MALYSVRLMRFNFDWMSGYSIGTMTEQKWLRRVMYLETVAGNHTFLYQLFILCMYVFIHLIHLNYL